MRRRQWIIIALFALSALSACVSPQHTWHNFKGNVGSCWRSGPEYDALDKVSSAVVSPFCVPAQTFKFIISPGPGAEDWDDIAAAGADDTLTAEPEPPPPDETPLTPPPPPPSVTTQGPSVLATASPGWEVQVAAVREMTAAETLAQPLRHQGYSVRVRSPDGGNDWYRVRITDLPTRAEAKVLARRLSREYPGAWVPGR